MNERALAPEPSFAYIRIDQDLSVDPNLDPDLDLDSNMPVNVETTLENASASARGAFGYMHTQLQ